MNIDNDQCIKCNVEGDYFMKLCVFGKCKGVGVTSLILRFVDNVFIDSKPAIPNDVKIKVLEDRGISIKIQIFDTGFKDFKINYLRGVHGYLIVYDITNRESFEQIRNITQDLKTYGNQYTKECFIIVGNKCDLESDRQIELKEAKDYFESIGIGESFYGEVSCKNPINIDNSFQKLFKKTSNILYPRNL
ncbi:hypothetical protein DICPUDRAFT_152785 [Dictyostelium purpureum]|uniref:Uncharacterized protein n=1 Tax=Dictyostelium purpureum TaxID=5786 RepID=F0ZM97_DICPU|nr:uncharacterized protein DICPUDRAFT_152785 [Dictyostelium purpureum]EGC34920.1 hypothetical protein DICPUDRAFT_152785 [Dictyostelium purpureum]|eukprot:XP_003288553.1 hypothetical protein DICPUDRAFT_152785 [Dictyostelium purpureum]